MGRKGKESAAQIEDIDFDLRSDVDALLDNDSDATWSDHGLDAWVTQSVPVEDIMAVCKSEMHQNRRWFDFAVHCVVLVMFVFVLLGLVGQRTERQIRQQFYTTQVIKDLILGNVPGEKEIDMYGGDLATPSDWALWMQSVTTPNIWSCSDADANVQQLTAQGQNYLLGSMRVRTRRMRNDSCSPQGTVFEEPELQPCYDEWHTWTAAGEEKDLRFGFPHPALFPQWADLVTFDHPPPSAVGVAEVMFGVEQIGAIVPVDLRGADVRNAYGVNAPGKAPRNVVDQSPNTDWEDGDFGSLELTFPARVRTQHITFVTGLGDVANDPVRWRVSGSDDGIFWTVVLEQTWVYPTAKERGAQLPWFAVSGKGNATDVSYRRYRIEFTQLRGVPNDAASNYRVNWEPSPYDPDELGKSDEERGLVPGRAPGVQMGEVRLRTNDRIVDAGLGYGGMRAAGVEVWVGRPGRAYSTNATSDYATTRASLIDGEVTTTWEGAVGSSLVFRLPRMVTLNAYSFVTAGDRPWKDPVDFRLEGTNTPDDPQSWQTLSNMANYATPLLRATRLPWLVVNDPAKTAPRIYQYYKLTPVRVRGGAAPDQLLYQHQDCTFDFLDRKTYGHFADYSCGGYMVDIPFNASCNAALSTMRALTSVNYPFIDNYATRLVSVEFVTYTPQFNDFVYAQFINEVSQGLWRNRHNVKAFSVYSAWHEGEMWYFATFYVLLLYLYFRFFYDWWQFTRRGRWTAYLWRFWTMYEFGMLALFLAAFVMKMAWLSRSEEARFRLRYPARYPEELAEISMIYETYKNIIEMCCIFVFLRSLRFAVLVERIGMVNKTVSGARYELAGCTIIFIHIVISFALMGNVLFGTTLFEYRTVPEAYQTLSLMLLGDFDYQSLKRERIILAPMFFWFFSIFALFIMLSFIIAILLTEFANVSEGMKKTLALDEQLVRYWVVFKRKLYPRRLCHSLKLMCTGRTRATVLEEAIDEMNDYWKLAHYCTTCGRPVTCLCRPASEVDYRILGMDCSKCGAQRACTSDTGMHCPYSVNTCERKVKVTRGDMRALIGKRAYDDLTPSGVDDLWQMVVWRKEERKMTVSDEEDIARRAVVENLSGEDGKLLASVSCVDQLDRTLAAFEKEVYNLRMLLQDEADAEHSIDRRVTQTPSMRESVGKSPSPRRAESPKARMLSPPP